MYINPFHAGIAVGAFAIIALEIIFVIILCAITTRRKK